MADKDSLIQYVTAKLGPEKLQQMVDEVENELANDPDIDQESIASLIDQLSFLAEHPESYKEVIQSLINEGVVDQGDAPDEFDPMFVAVMIIALQELLQRYSGTQAPAQFAKGGLAQAVRQVSAAGRNGDTILAHVNPREVAMLKHMGGSGRVNPQTGIVEFGLFKSIKKAFKKVFKTVAKVAKFALPAIATAIGGPWAGAAVGAGLGALGGGGLKGALLGGLGASVLPGGLLGDVAKSLGSSVLSSGIGSVLSNVVGPETLGAGLLGAAAGGVTGGLKGAVMGGLGTGLGAASAPGITSAYNVLQGGGGLTEAAKALMGSSSNVAPGINLSGTPGIADTAISAPGMTFGVGGPGIDLGTAASSVAPAATSGALKAFTPGVDTLMKGMFALNALGGKTPQVAMQNIQNSALTEAQKAAMARNLTDYTANWNATTLPAEGTPEYADMMDKINQGIGIDFMNPTLTQEQPAMARGGALTLLARGGGDGRSDSIHAKLSDGEYVIDAETVALLGNGSTKAGAAVLDNMRKQIRQQKGKALAKGKFSPNAKSPLAYMRGGL